MTARLPLALLPLLLSLTGCGDDAVIIPGGSAKARLDAGPFTVEAGEELVMCTYVRADNATAEDVVLFETDQSEGGHHLIVYTIDHAVDLPPSLCSQGGQPSWTQLLATQIAHEQQSFPEGVGFHIAQNQQFVLETHYINTTGEALEVDSAFEMTYAPPGSVTTQASTYFFGSLNLDIPPMAAWSTTTTCAPPRPMTLQTMFGHEHRRGTGVSVGIARAGGPEEMLYQTDEWEAPPVTVFENGAELGMTDSIRVTCDYQNDGPDRLRYPHEMCFAIGYYWPAEGSYVCVAGGGEDPCVCRVQGVLDTGPGGSTVNIDVTRAETVDGAIGAIDEGAPIYCSLWRSEDWAGIFPKAGAEPYYFRDAVDVRLASTTDVASFTIEDVTPGEYVAVCMMDTIGGGFMPGTGDVINIAAPHLTASTAAPVKVDVLLDFAVP
jgi:hypothetical protein